VNPGGNWVHGEENEMGHRLRQTGAELWVGIRPERPRQVAFELERWLEGAAAVIQLVITGPRKKDTNQSQEVI
jgi:hypothetical protein